MAGAETATLRAIVAGGPAPRFLFDREATARFTDLAVGTALGGGLADLAGRSVLLATAGQLTTALALIELDGVARRIVILPPDADAAQVRAVIAIAGIDAAVIDGAAPADAAPGVDVRVTCAPVIAPMREIQPPCETSEWVLMTSGTTGVPKLAVHSLASLTAALKAPSPADGAEIWGTFYDIRRYGGLQIYLRALLGRASLALSSAGETAADHLARLAKHGVTHLSGTPSQWRRALMVPGAAGIAPRYVRLSGEIADQAILDNLRAAFPQAVVGHVYASTEAGVAFDVNDGLAGFPAAYVGAVRDGVELKIADSALRIRSAAVASGYVGGASLLADADGYVDTGDIVERRGERYHFAGRKGGIINIGGLKVHPEEIESVINRHPQVRVSLVRARHNPVTGAIVVADVVLKPEAAQAQRGELKDDILKFCRATLPRHKVPAAVSFVPALKVAATGKLLRRHD